MSVWTSRDSIEWVNDSRLYYYPTGWLRRRELGVDMFLQGLDYAYTSEGWLKAINGEGVVDIGSDGQTGSTNEHFANDVFSLVLRYFPNDYRSVSGNPVEATINSGTGWLYKPYYTGWISSWSLNLDTLHTAYSFTYDQLGQLRHARTLTGFSGIDWNATTTKAFSSSYTYDPVGNIRTLKRYDKDGNLLDDLTYHYYDTLKNNRLEYITDAVITSNFLHDLETQSPGNYQYDSVGNMISDASRTLTVQYTYSNRPKFINFANRTLRMKYNPFGYRFFSGSGNSTGDVFIYSSQGQLVAKYKISGNTLKLDYLPIYEGSKRIGIVEPEDASWLDCPELMPCGLVAIDPCMLMVEGQPKPPCKKDSSLKTDRKYELTDHLGNVRVVIANQRIPIDTNGDSLVDYYKPLVKEISDYYPFGWEKQLTTVDPYPFTYQGQLFDKELGWQYYRYRNYDPIIARFWQVEPLIDSFPERGVYVFVVNNPIYFKERYGLQEEPTKEMIPIYTMMGWMAEKMADMYEIDYSQWVENPYGSMNEVNQVMADMFLFTSSFVGSVIAMWCGLPPFPMLAVFVDVEAEVDWVGPAWTQAYGIFFEWVSGTGPEVREFGESEPITQALKESALTDAFLNWLVKGEGQEYFKKMKQGIAIKEGSHLVSFKPNAFNVDPSKGETSLFLAPVDDISQFIGSATYNFEYDPNTGRINIEVVDEKTPYSFFYHAVPDKYKRNKLKYMGKTIQRYKFSLSLEEIENRINNAK